jgi:hypothetical protein
MALVITTSRSASRYMAIPFPFTYVLACRCQRKRARWSSCCDAVKFESTTCVVFDLRSHYFLACAFISSIIVIKGKLCGKRELWQGYKTRVHVRTRCQIKVQLANVAVCSGLSGRSKVCHVGSLFVWRSRPPYSNGVVTGRVQTRDP